MASQGLPSITRGLGVTSLKYRDAISYYLKNWKAESYHQAEIFKHFAYDLSTETYDYLEPPFGVSKSPEWQKTIEHMPVKENYKVGPMSNLLGTWAREFSSKIPLETYLKLSPIATEVLRSHFTVENKKQTDALGDLKDSLK